MDIVVLSVGGSILLSKETEPDYLKNLVFLLQKLSIDYKLYVVVGGGRIAREYIRLGRSLGLSEETLDCLGIDITRVNAALLSHLLPTANKTIPHTTDHATQLTNPIVIMGGTTPGHSTDAVAAELAQKTKAIRFINATNVDGIYDTDPNTNPNAKKIKEIPVQTLIKKYGTTWNVAGKNVVIDEPALAIIKQARLATFVVNGKRLDQLENALTGQPFDGTTILV